MKPHLYGEVLFLTFLQIRRLWAKIAGQRDTLCPGSPSSPCLKVLPKGRHIRVSLRAVAESDIPAHEYFGEIDSDVEKDSRFGKVQQLTFYKETDDESDLLIPYKNIPQLQALYLKPDPVPVKKHNFKGFNLKITADNDQPDVVKRLADGLCLNVEAFSKRALRPSKLGKSAAASVKTSSVSRCLRISAVVNMPLGTDEAIMRLLHFSAEKRRTMQEN